MTTNKETLQENNNKIKEITETLKNKILSAGSNVKWVELEDGSFRLEISSK